MSAPQGDRKRKLDSQTITDLFTAQQKPTSASQQSKRSRRNSESSPLSPTGVTSDSVPMTAPLPTAPAMTTADMYHFESKAQPSNNVVDLTASNGTPQKKNGVRKVTPTTGATGPKRIQVKNFKIKPKTDPKVYFEQIWKKLDEALDVVFANSEITFSLEELYRGVENLCRQKMAEDVYSRLKKRCEAYVAGPLKAVVQERVGKKDVEVLRGALQAWSRWGEQMKILNWVFCYLDRAYLLPNQLSLEDLKIQLFRKIVFEDTKLNSKIISGACDLIATDRAGGELDRKTFSESIKMFHELRVYTTSFEPRMLELSQAYIMDWAQTSSAEKSLADYLKAAVALMKSEMERVEMFGLDSTTRRDLLTLLEDHLIEKQQARLTNQDEFADLLDDNAVNDLEQLYSLLERRRLGTELRPAFMKWIEDTGTAIVFNEKEQDSMVVQLLTLKRQLDAIWKVAFHRNHELGHGLRESFEVFMNKTKKSSTTWGTDNSKPGEMIAKYVDMLLRGGAKAIPAQLSRKNMQPAVAAAEEEDNEDAVVDEDSEVNNQLDQVLDLFRFVHGKAVFEAFYKKDLARRLLMGRSASADAERSMLARLKTECGAGFTANLEQMFKDIELAREEMSGYKTIMEERHEKTPLDLSVNILSASAWPTYPDVPVIIPAQVKTATDKFEAHYKSKHSGRKLEWKHSLAHCQVKAKFPKGNKELVVSSFQAIVLLLFNDLGQEEKLDYDYLKQATGLPPNELNRTLQSLACAKIRPLTKHPKGREINPTDTFSLNANFSDPKYRIKINTVQLKETQAENKETHERVAADRNYETQAAIVRILKARKRINHSELVAETIKVTKSRGTLDVGGIKRNIDRLIEKEFLEREDDGSYSYIA